jgi:hypothetical protein
LTKIKNGDKQSKNTIRFLLISNRITSFVHDRISVRGGGTKAITPEFIKEGAKILLPSIGKVREENILKG